ncbi:MAG: AmmeMemoRadiSam system protein A [Phycisphaerales bacterium]
MATYTPDQQRRIIDITRDAVAASLQQRRCQPTLTDADAFLHEPRGCFVTLHSASHDLRGCIGTFDASSPLIDNLIEMAGASAHDPRFTHDPVTLDELLRLHIDVSILTPMQPIDDPRKLRLGIDGIYIVDHSGGHFGGHVSGCFLPEVAPEQNWDVETTLSMCCAHKMGLAPDAWREPTKLKFFVFQSSVISE